MSAAPASPAKNVDSFFKNLRQCRLLTDEQVDQFKRQGNLPSDIPKIASMLVKQKLLTSFQAKQLVAGRYRGFFLGSYKILDQLGAGGMGTVFAAEHTSLQRKVALKVMNADKALDKVSLERFYREARSAAALDHVNIVKLHDISQGAGVHFLVMEYVEGKNLQAIIDKTGPLHFTQAVQYIVQVAAGLRHAHDKGFVHRDIKPANLILDKNGTVKILDMGLARSFDKPEDNLTGLMDGDSVMGTVDYIAPEQALKQKVDCRSDIYSLGATLFNLVTGHTPFHGTTAQKLMGHQLSEVPKLSKLRAAVPLALNGIVAKMMAKSPDARFQNCSEVIDALAPWVQVEAQYSVVKIATILADESKQLTTVTVKETRHNQVKKKTFKKKKTAAGKLQARQIITACFAGGVLFVSMFMIWLLWPSGKSKNLQVSQQTIEDSKNIPNTPVPIGNLRPVFNVDFGAGQAGIKAFKNDIAEFRDKQSHTWYLNCWQINNTGEAEWTTYQGLTGLALRNVKGNSCQIWTDPLPGTAEPGESYHIKLEYRTGRTCQPHFMLRTNSDTTKELKVPLTAQTNWTKLERKVSILERGPLSLFIQNSGTEPDNDFVIRNIQISLIVDEPSRNSKPNASPPPSTRKPTGNMEVVYRTDFGIYDPFRIIRRGSTTLQGEGELIGHWFQCYDSTTQAEFTVKNVLNARVFGMNVIQGKPTAQFGSRLGEALKSLSNGTRVVVTVEYCTDAQGEGVVLLQQDGKDFRRLAGIDLPTSNNTWRTLDLPYQINENEPAAFVINTTKVGGWIYIRSLTLKSEVE